MKKIRMTIICALIVSILATSAVFAANYDSSTDPLITLSYLNEVFMPKISEQISGFSSTISQINDRVTKLESGGVTSTQLTTTQKKVTDLETKYTGLQSKYATVEKNYTDLDKKYSDLEKKYKDLLSTVESGGSAIYSVVFVNKGETILTPTGCELILRSGSAAIVSPFDNQGLSDTTDGMDLLNGFSVPMNHNLIVPRGNDGRGIKVTSDAGAYVMVRGGYSIVKP